MSKDLNTDREQLAELGAMIHGSTTTGPPASAEDIQLREITARETKEKGLYWLTQQVRMLLSIEDPATPQQILSAVAEGGVPAVLLTEGLRDLFDELTMGISAHQERKECASWARSAQGESYPWDYLLDSSGKIRTVEG